MTWDPGIGYGAAAAQPTFWEFLIGTFAQSDYMPQRRTRLDHTAWARRAGLRDRATHPDLNRFIAAQAEA